MISKVGRTFIMVYKGCAEVSLKARLEISWNERERLDYEETSVRNAFK